MSEAAWEAGGWLRSARRCPSPNFDARSGAAVDLIVVHSISLPPGEFGGDAIERFFCNRLDHDAHPYFAPLRGVTVSAHFLVRRSGACVQFVGTGERAWHAGRSAWRGREACNDFSIGIELEGLEGEAFEPAQYEALAHMIGAAAGRHPITSVVGHEHIAPGRKADPGGGFDWAGLRERVTVPGLQFAA